jgi:hypothetical protein
VRVFGNGGENENEDREKMRWPVFHTSACAFRVLQYAIIFIQARHIDVCRMSSFDELTWSAFFVSGLGSNGSMPSIGP